MQKIFIQLAIGLGLFSIAAKGESHLLTIRDHRVALMMYGIRDLNACISKIYQFNTGNLNYDRAAVSYPGKLYGQEGIYFVDPENLRTYFAKPPTGAKRDVIWSYPVCWKGKNGDVHKLHGTFYPGSAVGEKPYPSWARVSEARPSETCTELAQHIPSDSAQIFPLAQQKIAELYEERLLEIVNGLKNIKERLSLVSPITPPSKAVQLQWGETMKNILFEIEMLGPDISFQDMLNCARVVAPHHEKLLKAIDELKSHSTLLSNIRRLQKEGIFEASMIKANHEDFQKAVSILQAYTGL